MLFRVTKDLEGDSELAGGIMLKTWAGHVMQFHQKNRDAWRSQLELLLPQPQKDKRAKGNTLNNLMVFLKMMMMMIKYKNYL